MRVSRKVATWSALAGGGLVAVHLLAVGKFFVLARLFGESLTVTLISVAISLAVMCHIWIIHRRRATIKGGEQGWFRRTWRRSTPDSTSSDCRTTST